MPGVEESKIALMKFKRIIPLAAVAALVFGTGYALGQQAVPADDLAKYDQDLRRAYFELQTGTGVSVNVTSKWTQGVATHLPGSSQPVR